MKDFLVEIRDWYDNSSVTLENFVLRLVILSVAFLFHILIWPLSYHWGISIYSSLAKYLGYCVDIDNHFGSAGTFLYIFTIAVSLFLIHVLIYVLFWLTLKIKPHIDMLISVAFVTFLFRSGLTDTHRGGWWPRYEFKLAWGYAYATVLLVIFCAAIILSKRLSVKKFTFRILASAAVSLLLGTAICVWIWQFIVIDIINKS